MSTANGQPLEGMDHLRQSIRDVLATPLGSRVVRPEYGSRLFELVDAPMTPGWLADVTAATVAALERWEPRIRVKAVQVTGTDNGRPVLTISGVYRPDGKDVKLEGILT